MLAPEEKVFLGMKGVRELPTTQYSYAASRIDAAFYLANLEQRVWVKRR